MWLEYVLIVAVLLAGIYSFGKLVGFEKRVLTRRTSRTAEDIYGSYPGPRKPRRDATRHGAGWADGENGPSD